MDAASLALLPARERTRAVALLRRDAQAGVPVARAAADALLSHREAWVRWNGVAAAVSGEALAAATSDPSARVRARAWARLREPAFAEALAGVLATHAHAHRAARIAGQALRAGRAPAVEAIVARHAVETREPVWIDLLPFATEPVVAAHLGLFEAHASADGWVRLARWHPALVVRAVRPTLATSERDRARVSTVLPTLAVHAPEHGVELLEALAAANQDVAWATGALQELLSRAPGATLRLVRQLHERDAEASRPALHVHLTHPERVAPDTLAWVVARVPELLAEGKKGRAWFRRLSDAARTAVVEAWLAGDRPGWGAFLFGLVDDPRVPARFDAWRRVHTDDDGVVPVDALAKLPRALREREARRHLDAVPALQMRPEARRSYAALLGFDEAAAVLAPDLGHPEGEVRGRALARLIGTARQDPEGAARALAVVRRRKNEQDPVRLAMLTALAAVPPQRLAGLAPDVSAVIDDALAASDLSPATARSACRLALRLAAPDRAHGLASTVRVIRLHGARDASLGALVAALLTPADTAAFDALLAEPLARATERESTALALALLRPLPRRLLRRVPRSLDAIEPLAAAPRASEAEGVLGVLARAGRARFRRVAFALLDRDPSAAWLPGVARLLAEEADRRLDVALADAPMTGRWATGRTHWVLDFGEKLDPWHSGQQQRYAAQLGRLAADPERDVGTLRWAIERLAALGWASPALLVGLADDPRPPVQELALRALPRVDGSAGLEKLLACLADSRARLATYALRAALVDLPPAAVRDHLARVPMERVSAAKEALRLLSELGGVEGRDELVRLAATALHRDVRRALLAALRRHLDHPPAWEVIAAAAGSPDPQVVAALAGVPSGRLSDTVDERLSALLARVLATAGPDVRAALLPELRTTALRDEARVLFHAALGGLDDPDEDTAAALLRVALARMRPDEAGAVAARLVAILPDRRRAARLLAELAGTGRSWWIPEPQRGVARAVVRHLVEDPVGATHAIRLAAAKLPVAEWVELLGELDRRGHLHPDALQAAMERQAWFEPAPIIAGTLGAASPRIRRVALAAVLEAARRRTGWTPALREHLRALQQDAAIEVAAPAAWVFPPPEPEGGPAA